jgi:pimeloyl-ACP methyl ester carboxylesterase
MVVGIFRGLQKQEIHMDQTQLSSDQGTYIQVNGLRMYYESQGAGTPVILLHGGLETCQMWAPVVSILSKFYQVITPDSRGHGRTDKSAINISYPLMAEDFAQFIQVLGLEKPFLAGYSDGGQVALYMAINHPGLVRGYMIGATELSMTDEWRQTLHGTLAFEGPGSVNLDKIAQTSPELVHSLQEKHDGFHEPGYWKMLLNEASRYWLSPPHYNADDLANIVDPALFWFGDRDVFCPPEQALKLYRMVNKSELAVIPNADHFTMMQQIDIAAMILMNFMQRVIGNLAT